ncbi:hypothetical protein [Bradyrhizobium sp. sBnM-33]|uniref:hypothetical protein n=1 Tax=Bradyrhizobium sp. sBnM-33 TaxID=2831780 RepID=UPI001BCAEE5F|nr:hypothetical protein [Bradyrhizobium sp. sBnM-33]WOH52524.1 hypothetical protein RX328_10385 [Bradyrhizobium sp. sBnM-33]
MSLLKLKQFKRIAIRNQKGKPELLRRSLIAASALAMINYSRGKWISISVHAMEVHCCKLGCFDTVPRNTVTHAAIGVISVACVAALHPAMRIFLHQNG